MDKKKELTCRFEPYKSFERIRAVAACIAWDASDFANIVVRASGYSWHHETATDAKDLAFFYCQNMRAREEVQDCSCAVVAVNDDLVLDIPESFVTRMLAEQAPNQSETLVGARDLVEVPSEQPESESEPAVSALAREAEDLQKQLDEAKRERDLAEAARAAAERNVRDAEAARLLAEEKTREAEDLHKQLEAAKREREVAEAARQAAEQKIQDAEAARRTVDREGREAEKLERQLEAAKRERDLAEAARQAAEQKVRDADAARRLAAAKIREAEELQRQLDAAKRERDLAEAGRQSAEQKVRDADAARKLAENKSLEAEELRRQLEEAKHQRDLAEAERKAIEERARRRRLEDLTKGLEPADLFEKILVTRAVVRALPERDSGEIASFHLNDEVHVIGILPSGWVQVASEGEPIGWLHHSALRKDMVIGRVSAREADKPVANQPNFRGRNHALIIGNNNYTNLPDLKTAVGDAAALSELLKLRYAFDPKDVKLLLNADRPTIFRELARLRRELDADDRLLLYYAGHGQIDEVTGAGYWQPVDAEVTERYTWIANDDIRREVKGMAAKHVLVMVDSCFSGTLMRGQNTYRGIPKDRFFSEIDSYASRTAISSGGIEPVADAGSGGHSVFAFYLLKVLRENEGPYLTGFELFGKFVRAVTNNSDQKPEYGTVSDAGDEGSGDFTFILRSGG